MLEVINRDTRRVFPRDTDKSARDADSRLRIRFDDRLGDVVRELGMWAAAKRDENGVGIALVIAYLVVAGAAALALRRGGASPAITFARCVLVSYSLELFFRGVGYFSGTGLLMIAALWLPFDTASDGRSSAPQRASDSLDDGHRE